MKNPWSTISKPITEANIRRVSDSHPASLFWGLDKAGHQLFIIDCPPASLPARNALPELVGIQVGLRQSQHSGHIVLRLNEPSNWEIFLALCIDLIHASESDRSAEASISTIIRRLRKWQETLKRKRPETLSLEEIKGLSGELLFLSKTIAPKHGWDKAVEFWKGPECAPQDFSIYDTAVEVKSQSGSSKPYVKISSLEQLNPQLPKAFLTVFTFAAAETGSPAAFNLNDLVVSIRKDLTRAGDATCERFESLIYQAGYAYCEYYDSILLQLISTRHFKVSAGFPRIESLAVPAGLSSITYNLSIEACTPFETTPSELP